MTDKAFLEAVFLLFGRKLAKVPPFPANNDGIKFNFATLQWELAPFGGAGEANTSSNVGAGAGLALPKVGVDLPFKSLIALAPLLITVNPTDITFSITAQQNTFILGDHFDGTIASGTTEFIGIYGTDSDSSELDTQGFLAFTFTVVRFTLRVNSNSKNMSTTFSARDDGADIPNTSFVVAGGVTGSFDSGVISETVLANSLTNFKAVAGGGSGTIGDYGQYLECEK